jgi:class 3 adenylate cyclase
VRCAVKVQAETAARGRDVAEDRRIALRVGVNLGDIIIDGDDIFGDGVNVAARLEAIAAPGSIPLSDDVLRQARGNVDAQFANIAPQTLKNIAQPVEVWQWTLGGVGTPTALPLALPDKPSIAVLPF